MGPKRTSGAVVLNEHFVDRENALTEPHDYDEKLVETDYKDNQATIVNGKIKAVLL